MKTSSPIKCDLLKIKAIVSLMSAMLSLGFFQVASEFYRSGA